MTVDEFRALKVDDEFTPGSMFPKLSKAAVHVRVTSVEKFETRAVATWFGVTLGVWIGEVVNKVGGEKVEWSFA